MKKVKTGKSMFSLIVKRFSVYNAVIQYNLTYASLRRIRFIFMRVNTSLLSLDFCVTTVTTPVIGDDLSITHITDVSSENNSI
jgi:hypothetical protein